MDLIIYVIISMCIFVGVGGRWVRFLCLPTRPMEPLSIYRVMANICMHWRRLVINIGGQKFGSQLLGGAKILVKYFLRQHSKKIPFYSQKFLRTFFSHRQLFLKIYTPFIQNLLPFLCIFLSLSLFLLSFMFLH